jgi:hypothetical protein
MKVQFNTDTSTNRNEKQKTYFIDLITEQLIRFSDHITRVEVHLSDVNGDKEGPNDKRCLLEVRIEGRQPIAVTKLADTYEKAVSGATEKLISALDKIFGRIKKQSKE